VTCGKAEISTCDPELAWEIARRPRDFQQPSNTALIMGQFGRNVLTDNGEKWAKQRKVVAGVINERISKTVFNESIRQTEGLLGEVYEKADGGVSDSNRLFDMMKKITIHVLSGAGMGASVAWDGNDGEKPREGYKMTYIEACKTVINGVAGPIILPIWLMKSWPWFLPGHEFLQAMAPAMVEFPLHTKHMLEQERQRTLSHGGQTQSNIMSQLLQASEQEEKSKALTEEEMLGNLFIFTAAGFDTTANTLSYALVLLCRYPEWQDWILEEVDTLLPPSSSSSSEPLDYTATFPKATRIMAVMLETLRIFVPVIHLARDTHKPEAIQTSQRTAHSDPGRRRRNHETVPALDSRIAQCGLPNLPPGSRVREPQMPFLERREQAVV
jgi:cytochrome P450